MRLKDLFKNKWYIACFFFGAIALVALILYAQNRSFIFVGLFLVSIILGMACLYKGKKDPDKGATVSIIPPTLGEVNCLKIYGIKKKGIPAADKISFENVPDELLKGNRWYFEDIHQWLHVLYNDVDNPDEWEEFDLPDEKYIHPGRLAWVLNQEDYEDFMRLEPSMFERLKPLLMLGANALVLFFIFLVSSGGE